MKIYPTLKLSLFGMASILLSACSMEKSALQNNDDVYFADIEAKQISYTIANNRSAIDRNDRSEYLSDSYDDDFYRNNSRFNYDNVRNNFTWRDYYYMDRIGYDPFFWGPSINYGTGWNLSFGMNPYFNDPFMYGYAPVFYRNSWNNFGYYSPFNRWSPYGGVYSYYQPGYYGYFGNYGNGYYRDVNRDIRPMTPRPRGAYDNARPNGNGNIPLPPNAGRPDRSETRERPANVEGRSSSPNGERTSRPVSSDRTTQPSNRPVRENSRPSSSGSSTSERRESQPASRPVREDRPSSMPSNDNGSRSSNSSSSSGSSSSRPSRPGGR